MLGSWLGLELKDPLGTDEGAKDACDAVGMKLGNWDGFREGISDENLDGIVEGRKVGFGVGTASGSDITPVGEVDTASAYSDCLGVNDDVGKAENCSVGVGTVEGLADGAAGCSTSRGTSCGRYFSNAFGSAAYI